MSKVVIQFRYKPSNYFESTFTYSESNYEITLGDGIVETTIPGTTEIPSEKIISEIKQKIVTILNARMLLTHKIYQLEAPRIDIHYPDKSKKSHYRIEALAGEIKLTGFAPDIVLKDALGNIIRDTRAERLAFEENILKLFAQTDNQIPTVKTMINSYEAAIQDPKNELVHLYEIIDALKHHFVTKQNALSKLNFDETSWDRLHSLSNDEPLAEGRHRGSKTSLRKATDAELEEARRIAKSLIVSYISKLGQKNNG
jgi:hypothetical protein